MSNPLHPDVVKIGQSSKDPNERRKELATTGVLEEFVLEYRALTEDYISLEREIHKALSKQRVKANREFFTISVPEAIEKIREIAGNRIESDKVYYVSPEVLDAIANKKREKQELLEKEAEERRIKYEAIRAEQLKKIREEEDKKKTRALKEEKRRAKLNINRDKQRLKRAKEKEKEKEEQIKKKEEELAKDGRMFIYSAIGIALFVFLVIASDIG